MDKRKIGKAIGISAAVLGTAFIGVSIIAKKKKPDSVYDNEPNEKNPFEGKKVVLVEDENDNVNADGVRGHLEIVGESEYKPSFYEKYIKRSLDVILSFGGIVALSPLLGAIALAIKIDDPGPIFFGQKRVGRNKQFFRLHKFRTMKMSTPHDMPTHMLENPDQYITRVGKFLRKHSLDELPQIWDIFLGNMSVIGPRPGLWNQDQLTAERDKYGANDVRPGLTGWAQINGRDAIEIDEKARLDGEYVSNLSLKMDAKVFMGSLGVFAKDDNVVEGGTGKKEVTKEDDHTKKKILVICQYYRPEPFRISDICEEMVRRGHEVQVVTGYPNYPEGVFYEGYGKGKHIDEVISGVKVHRCYTIPREAGAIKRMLNYYSYAASSTQYVLSSDCVASDGKPFDVVFCNQLSPVMMADAAIAYKKKYKVPAVMYCLDLWPESLIAGGIKRESKIYKYYHHVSKRIYKQMDKILITSRMFSDYLRDEFGIRGSKIEYLPQYAEDIFAPDQCKKESDDSIDLMFAGNVGSAQSVDTIINAARLTSDIPNLRWHIVGSGSELDRLKKMADGLQQVIFHGRRPLEEMPKYYAIADAMLVTMQKDEVLSLTLPGKVQTYMAAGKTIIAAADGETQLVIKESNCGYYGNAEDAEALAENVRKFIAEKELSNMEAKSREYYDAHFNKDAFTERLKKSLMIG